MAIPTIAIFVKHSTACKDRFEGGNWRRCRCRKYLRWFHGGKQHRQAVKTRSWETAEDKRRELKEKFKTGLVPTAIADDSRKTIERAIELYLSSKRTKNVGDSALGKIERELERFKDFMTARGKFFPYEIDIEAIEEYRATWAKLYSSSATRAQVQTRFRGFLRYCVNADWMKRVPDMDSITIDEPPTMPLSDEEYETFLTAIAKVFPAEKAPKVRALVQLMRHSGLAIRDAVTITKAELRLDAKSGVLRVLTSRQKTGQDVYVPIRPEIAKEILASVNGSQHPFWTGNGFEQSAVTNWQHDLRAAFRAAFGKDTNFTPHCLRDTAACSWLTAGIPMEEVAKLLGHSSIKITEKHYAAWAKSRQDRADSLVMATWGTK